MAVPNNQPPQIQRLILLNQSDIPLGNVHIYITATREQVTCGSILPRSECSTGFPSREYQGNSFDVTWVEHQQTMIARDILATVPGDLTPGQPVNAVITFRGDGNFSAGLVPRDAARQLGQ